MRPALLALVLLTAIPAAADIHGAWNAIDQGDGKLHLSITLKEWNNWGRTIRIDEVSGLSPDVVQSASSKPAQFQIRREGGTIAFDGTFREGYGGGQFTFVQNPRYLPAIRATGIEFDIVDTNQTEEEIALSLTMADVTADYIRSLKPLFPEITLREARRARGVDVTPEYVKSLRAAGVEIGTLREVIRLAGVNVTPQYIAELAAAGYKNLSVRDLTRLAANGIDARFIREASRQRRRP